MSTTSPKAAPAERSALQRVASRFVDLRPGEIALVRATFVTLAGLIAGHTILETARDALFLTRLPTSRLALVYVVVAGATLLASRLNARLVERIGRQRALTRTLFASSLGTAIFYFVPKTPAALFALYTWSALIGTSLVGQFWMLADRVFTVAQGKRLFGLIGAGGIVGAVAGGGGAALVLAIVPVSGLLLVASGAFLVTAIHLTALRGESDCRAENAASGAPSAPEGAFGTLRGHAHVRQMAMLTALSTAALLVADYLFKTVAVQRVPAADLGTFLARLVAVLNALSLVVQLLLTGRIIRHLGVVSAIGMLPLLLAVGGFGTLLTGGSLMTALLIKSADGALRHSTHRVGSEILWMPLPQEARERARAILDSFGTRAVQASAAVFLLVLDAFGAASPRMLAGITVLLSAAWLLVNHGLKGSYLELLRSALAKGSLELHAVPTELDGASVEAVLEALSSRDPRRVIAAMDLLRDRQRDRLIPGLVLYHESEHVLLHALRYAGETGRRDWAPLISRLLAHGAAPVRTGAVRALANLGQLEALKAALSDENPSVRAYAAFCMAAYGPATPHDDATLAALARLDGEQGKVAAVALLGAIADHGDARFADVMLALADDPRPDVAAAAIAAMTRVRDERFVPVLVARLSRRSGRSVVQEALVHQGEPALAALGRALRDAETPMSVRVHIPLAIARFGTKEAADLLAITLAADPLTVVRYRALRALVRLAPSGLSRRERVEEELRKALVEHLRGTGLLVQLERGPHVALDARASASRSLLIETVHGKQREALERVFRLLQLLYPSEDLHRVHRAIRLGDGVHRAHAAEFLEALALGRPGPQRETRELVRLVLDDLPGEERIARARRLIPTPPADYEEAIAALLQDHDDMVAALSAEHASDLGTARRAEVQRLGSERAYPNVKSPFLQKTWPQAKAARAALEVNHGG